MTLVIRFIGIMNAAIWFGGAFFFTIAIGGLFSGRDITYIFKEYSGVIALHVAERYYAVFYWCGMVAILHQLAEWVYLGKALHRWTIGVLAGVFVVGLMGGLWWQPRMNQLYQVKHARPGVVAPAVQAQASRSFAFWKSLSLVSQFLALTGLGYYTWRVAAPPLGPRFVSSNKFRS